jgi:hypothetical protein
LHIICMKGKLKARKECVRFDDIGGKANKECVICFKSIGKECLKNMKLFYEVTILFFSLFHLKSTRCYIF